MRVLLDTHVFLWWITDDAKLPGSVRNFISDGNNELFFSAASCWEIVIKSQLGRMSLPHKIENFLPEQMVLNAVQGLPIQIGHALYVINLPDHHRDPFDRIIVAQAQLEKMPIITSDPLITKYDVDVIWRKA